MKHAHTNFAQLLWYLLSGTQSTSLICVTCLSHKGICISDPGVHSPLSDCQVTAQGFKDRSMNSSIFIRSQFLGSSHVYKHYDCWQHKTHILDLSSIRGQRTSSPTALVEKSQGGFSLVYIGHMLWNEPRATGEGFCWHNRKGKSKTTYAPMLVIKQKPSKRHGAVFLTILRKWI